MSDSILEGFGEAIVDIDEKEFEDKLKKISPFDFVNSINSTKEKFPNAKIEFIIILLSKFTSINPAKDKLELGK